MRTTRLSAAALSVAAALTLSPLAPAHADAIGVRDRADLDHGVDLRSVVVDHRAENVVVTTTHTDLRPSFRTGSSGAVYLDTDELDAGPEYVFVGAFFSGSDYQLLHTDGFGNRRWGQPVEGSYELRLRYLKDQARIRIARDAIGSPDQVRVAVRVSGTRPDGTSRGVVDWLKEPRSFTEWVAQ
ncbi:MAG: hypothetical protein JWN68_227 [Nocardioides sp.]|jgi:hypothetical protein|uniref:hypothetical protein n=1 Tax=Nocardioides sp. TaxID=35761 RepID=UPI00262CF7A5|nr:hypothetical protein [Nocardioides sp.]MCW2832274.1 hypothetical protein [Nocardioides sp.]